MTAVEETAEDGQLAMLKAKLQEERDKSAMSTVYTLTSTKIHNDGRDFNQENSNVTKLFAVTWPKSTP